MQIIDAVSCTWRLYGSMMTWLSGIMSRWRLNEWGNALSCCQKSQLNFAKSFKAIFQPFCLENDQNVLFLQAFKKDWTLLPKAVTARVPRRTIWALRWTSSRTPWLAGTALPDSTRSTRWRCTPPRRTPPWQWTSSWRGRQRGTRRTSAWPPSGRKLRWDLDVWFCNHG